MSIVIFAYYDYWGDNGRCHQKWVDEFEDEASAIRECCDVSAVHQMGFVVEKIVGSEDPEMLKIKIHQAVKDRLEADKLKARIETLKRYIKDSEKWLADVESETQKRTAALVEHKKALSDLGQD